MIDDLAKSLVLQMPAVGVLFVFVVTLYRDMRNDASTAQKQREESIATLLSLKEEISKLADKLSAHE